MIRTLLIISLLSFLSNTNAGIFGPSSFDECILESMKGVTGDVAARAIYASCRKKFPTPARPLENIPAHEIPWKQVTGGFDSYLPGYFGGDIYNDSKDWTFVEMTIELRPKKGADGKMPNWEAAKFIVNLNFPLFHLKHWTIFAPEFQ